MCAIYQQVHDGLHPLAHDMTVVNQKRFELCHDVVSLLLLTVTIKHEQRQTPACIAARARRRRLRRESWGWAVGQGELWVRVLLPG